METVDIGNPAYKNTDFGTRECEICEGKKKVIKYCGCLTPCLTCDETEYEDCRACDGEGIVAVTEEEHDDDIASKLEDLRDDEF